jgi:hypothetical protein
MSKVEPDEFINDRYKAIEERLSVSRARFRRTCKSLQADECATAAEWCVRTPPPPQIVRKRLNQPLTLAEKVRGAQGVDRSGGSIDSNRRLHGLARYSTAPSATLLRLCMAIWRTPRPRS